MFALPKFKSCINPWIYKYDENKILTRPWHIRYISGAVPNREISSMKQASNEPNKVHQVTNFFILWKNDTVKILV